MGSQSKIVAFVGKGGVGKTTLAVAYARALLGLNIKNPVVISLDMQHNHRDLILSHGLPISFECFSGQADEDLRRVLEAVGFGKYRDLVDVIGRDFTLILQLAYYVQQHAGRTLILDFPPNTASFNLFRMENVTRSFFYRVLTIKQRIRKLLTGHDETLETVQRMEKAFNDLNSALKNAMIFVVAIPSYLGYLEADRVIEALSRNGFSAGAIVLNMLQPDPGECPYCKSRLRNQRFYANAIRKMARRLSLPLIEVPYTPDPLGKITEIFTEVIVGDENERNVLGG